MRPRAAAAADVTCCSSQPPVRPVYIPIRSDVSRTAVPPRPSRCPSRASLERHSNIIPLSTHADGRTAEHLRVTCGAPLRREHAVQCLSAGSQCRPSARAPTSTVVSVYRRRTCKPGATEIVMGIVMIDKTKLKQGRLKLFGIRAHL